MNLQIQLKKKDDTKYFDTTTISPISVQHNKQKNKEKIEKISIL